MTTTLTQAEFERQFGADTIRRLFTDDGGPQADASLVMHTLERADSEALGLLMKGGGEPWARKILAGDIAARGHAYNLAAAMAGLRKTEFLNGDGAGGTLFDPAAKNSRAQLKEMGEAQLRSKAETEAGANRHVAAGTRHRPTDQFVFLTNRNRSGGRDRSGY